MIKTSQQQYIAGVLLSTAGDVKMAREGGQQSRYCGTLSAACAPDPQEPSQLPSCLHHSRAAPPWPPQARSPSPRGPPAERSTPQGRWAQTQTQAQAQAQTRTLGDSQEANLQHAPESLG